MLALTGSSGFIGSYIASHLPFPQKRLTRKGNEQVSESFIEIRGNLTNLSDVSRFVEDTSTLVHLACSCNPRNSNNPFTDHIENDLKSTVNLFETFAKCNPEGHVVFASTGGNMYQTGLPHIERTEKDLPTPASGYSIQKLATENYLRLLCQNYGIKATVLRIGNPYGMLLPASRGHGLIGIALNKLLSNENLSIIDSPDSVRDYLHLLDLAKAFQTVIKHPPKSSEFRLFNVSSGVGFSLNQVLDLIETVTKKSIKKTFVYSEKFDLPSWSVLSSLHLQETLGWRPEITLSQGIEMMWNEITNQWNNKPLDHSSNILEDDNIKEMTEVTV